MSVRVAPRPLLSGDASHALEPKKQSLNASVVRGHPTGELEVRAAGTTVLSGGGDGSGDGGWMGSPSQGLAHGRACEPDDRSSNGLQSQRPSSLVKRDSSFRLYQSTSIGIGMESTGELEAILADMRSNIADSAVIIKGSVVLSQIAARCNSRRMGRSFMTGGPSSRSSIVNAMGNGEIGRLGGIVLLVDALRLHAENRRVCLKICNALENLLDAPENSHSFTSVGGDNILIDIVKLYRGDRLIIESVRRSRPALVRRPCCSIQ